MARCTADMTQCMNRPDPLRFRCTRLRPSRVLTFVRKRTVIEPLFGRLKIKRFPGPGRHGTVQTINPQHQDDQFGGFPNPLTWFIYLLNRFFPSLKRNVRRTFTIPRTPLSLAPEQGEIPQGARPVPYFRFPARVGHNSRFIGLSDDNYEELGGVEYRALTALLWIVSGVSTFPLPSPYQKIRRLRMHSQYHIVMLLIPFAVLAPYMSMSRWKDDFLPPNQHRAISPIWWV